MMRSNARKRFSCAVVVLMCGSRLGRSAVSAVRSVPPLLGCGAAAGFGAWVGTTAAVGADVGAAAAAGADVGAAGLAVAAGGCGVGAGGAGAHAAASASPA